MYRQITAHYSGNASCGHLIIMGDAIGWHRESRRTLCQKCMERELRKQQEKVLERMKVE